MGLLDLFHALCFIFSNRKIENPPHLLQKLYFATTQYPLNLKFDSLGIILQPAINIA